MEGKCLNLCMKVRTATAKILSCDEMKLISNVNEIVEVEFVESS